MSDSALQTFYRYGTAAERAAFTPDPPAISGVDVQVIYIWYETDTDNVYIYTTAWKGPFSNANVTGPFHPFMLMGAGAS